MKKILLIVAIALGAISSHAQQAIESPSFWQNWSLGLDLGVTTPLKHAPFWGDMRGLFGVTARKQLTPTFGLGAEVQAGVNTSSWRGWEKSTTAFDNSYLGMYGTVDLFNLFGKTPCTKRGFNIEVLAGLGWGHDYISRYGDTGFRQDKNYLATKVGLNFNINFSEHFTLALKPSLMWNMNYNRGKNGHPYYEAQSTTYYDNVAGVFNFQAGLIWHLSGYNFDCVRPYDQAAVDALNAQVNDLRAAVEASLANGALWEAKCAELAADLAACMAREPEVKEVVKENNTNTLQSVRYVFFKLASSVITNDQMPNVEMIAAYLKNHKEAKVVVKGYASKDGNLDFNIKLAQARAEAVKNALIKKYGIKADRITAEGQGIGEMFAEESWNRVSICTIED